MLRAGVSVVVCCYNSEAVLPRTLEHLSRQLVPDKLEWEIILVDNASSDDTQQVATNLWRELHCETPLRVVFEKNPGLSEARKRGVLEATYDLLIFCDDDNWLCDAYIAEAHRLMVSNANIDIAGGEGVAVSNISMPAWFESYQRSFAVGPQGVSDGTIDSYPYGAGMVVRTADLKRAFELGFTSLLSDRKGSNLSSGGDGELAEWIAIFDKCRWYYCSALKFRHYMIPERLGMSQLEKLQVGFGEMSPVILLYKNLRRRKYRNSRFLWITLVLFFTARLLKHRLSKQERLERSLRLKRDFAALSWLLANRAKFQTMAVEIEKMRKKAESVQAYDGAGAIA
jgi:glycosyltransferase involved in cell wall biosynthesis